eukprot:scaffold278390_cov139-Cyclotella_meneghiniana.AAC.1
MRFTGSTRPFRTPHKNFLILSPCTILSSSRVSESGSSVCRHSLASLDAIISSAAILESAWMNALSSWNGAMTKE